MRYPTPFFWLIGRPAVFWLAFLGLACVGIMIVGLSNPGEAPGPYVNGALLGAAAFPTFVGWLFGFTIRELQHSTFAWPLPRVRGRLASGYVLTGAAVALFVAMVATQATSAQNSFLLYFVLGMSGYCVAGVLFDPEQPWGSALAFVVVAGVIFGSQRLADLAAAYPLPTLAAAAAPAPFALHRFFARAAFRSKPFGPMSPFLGSYWAKHTAEYARARQAKESTGALRWTPRYLGTSLWRWAGATAYETYGQITWNNMFRLLHGALGLLALFALFAWSDMGEAGFLPTFFRIVHADLLLAPRIPPLGAERGVNPMVVFFIAGAGAMVAMRPQSPLATALSYPLSRRQRASVALRSALIDIGVFFAFVAAILWTIGLAAGWLAGHEAHFDHAPFFLVPLSGTIILMPLAHLGALYFGRSADQRQAYSLLPVMIGVTVFAAVVLFWTVYGAGLFVSPALGLGTSAVLFAATLALLSHRTHAFFAAQDLV